MSDTYYIIPPPKEKEFSFCGEFYIFLYKNRETYVILWFTIINVTRTACWEALSGMNRNWGRACAWLLCLVLILGLSLPAFAEEVAAEAQTEPADNAPAEAPFFEGSILDSDAITKMVEDFLAQKGVPKDRVGIGFCYTATGDEWFLNPDTWFYPGSMYKVPLMMILSERLRDGQIDEDTQIGGLALDTVYNYVLVHSNNDYAHAVRRFLIDGQGDDQVWRKEAQQYARLDKYDERYLLYCYFSPRYMTQVMETLYNDPDRFPKVMDNLLEAEQGHYFRLPEEMRAYDVAQKYGSYIDNEGSDWNHTTGIIYTPNPFIITVMTKNVGGSEQLISQLGVLFKDYTLKLDDELAAYQEEQARLEAELQAAEEAARLAAEQPQASAQASARQDAPAQAAQRPSQPETQLQTTTPDRAERGHRALVTMLLILLGASVVGGIGSVIIIKENERKRYESYKRRFEEEMRQEALEREQARRRQPAAARPADTQPGSRPQSAQPKQKPPAARPETPPAQPSRRAPAPVRQQPKQYEPMKFDDEQWLHDEEDE